MPPTIIIATTITPTPTLKKLTTLFISLNIGLAFKQAGEVLDEELVQVAGGGGVVGEGGSVQSLDNWPGSQDGGGGGVTLQLRSPGSQVLA